MSNDLLTPGHNQIQLTPTDGNKDIVSRVSRYEQWLHDNGNPWWAADLVAYAEHLKTTGIKNATVNAHLGSIRSQYERILAKPDTREKIMAGAPDEWSFADKAAFASEFESKLRKLIASERTNLPVIEHQDNPHETDHIWMTPGQASEFIRLPGVDTLRGLRDTALIVTLLTTGIRQAELCELHVEDLRRQYRGSTCLFVREGKGGKSRMVPWGANVTALRILNRWMSDAGITEGHVFRGFWRGYTSVRPTGLSKRGGSVEHILEAYPIIIEGDVRVINPHDMRRFYARQMTLAGMDIYPLRDNMGHTSIQFTGRYIGHFDVKDRETTESFIPVD